MSLTPYWITSDSYPASCVEDASPELAQRQFEKRTRARVKEIKPLPYPAEPRISERKMCCPSFCYTPGKCAGHTSCPKAYACSD
jgi:hypothetical protein